MRAHRLTRPARNPGYLSRNVFNVPDVARLVQPGSRSDMTSIISSLRSGEQRMTAKPSEHWMMYGTRSGSRIRLVLLINVSRSSSGETLKTMYLRRPRLSLTTIIPASSSCAASRSRTPLRTSCIQACRGPRGSRRSRGRFCPCGAGRRRTRRCCL